MDVTDAVGPAGLHGTGRWVRDVARALAARDDLALVGLSARRFPGPEVVWEQTVLPLAACRHESDVVHAPNCFLPLLRGCAGVVTVHDLAFEAFPADFSARTGAKFRALAPRAVRSAERVVCVSAFTRDDVCSRYGIPESSTAVVLGAPSLPLGDGPVPAGAPYLLGVGDLRVKKHWGALVRAWRALRATGETDLRLVIAGRDAGEAAALRALAGPEPLELPGFVDDATLDALMRGARALVHPSLYEGFGLVVAEAMARGVPVAVASGTALPEAAGGAGVVFDPHDDDAVAAAILETLARADELRAAGLRRAAELSWDAAAASLSGVYAAAVQERG